MLLFLSLSLGESGCIQALQTEEFVLRELSYQGDTVVQENHLTDKVLHLRLHIKLNLMRNFTRKAVNMNGAAFQHLRVLFSALGSVLSSKKGIDPRGAEG